MTEATAIKEYRANRKAAETELAIDYRRRRRVVGALATLTVSALAFLGVNELSQHQQRNAPTVEEISSGTYRTTGESDNNVADVFSQNQEALGIIQSYDPNLLLSLGIEPGDTLNAIAIEYAPAGSNYMEYQDDLTRLNGDSPDITPTTKIVFVVNDGELSPIAVFDSRSEGAEAITNHLRANQVPELG